MTDKVLFKSTNYFNAVRFRNQNGGKLINESNEWRVIDESMAIQMGIGGHEDTIETHQNKIKTLKSLEKHIDHIENHIGQFEHNPDDPEQADSHIGFHKKIPAMDKHDFGEHMRKGGFKLVSRDPHSSLYTKNDPSFGSLSVAHDHSDDAVHHSVRVSHTYEPMKESTEVKKDEKVIEENRSLAKKENEPDEHIMYSLRKACHSASGHDIQFGSGLARVAPGHAHAALVYYEMLKPAEKDAFQKKISPSYEAMKKALKEVVELETKVV